MDWNSFVAWWQQFFKAIGDWLILPDEDGLNYLTRVILAIVFIVAGHFLIKLIIHLVKKAFKVQKKVQVDISAKTFSIQVINIALRAILVILVLSTLKVDLTSVAAIFSAATVAIGLSLQNLISAFASGVVLLKSKHFKTGDYISIVHSDGTCEGTVKQVSMISTYLITFDNQTVIIPNNKLLEGVITNFSNQTSRRCVLTINVEYETDIEKAKRIIMEVIESDERILKDPKPFTHVSQFGEYYIQFALKFYTSIDTYWDVYNCFLEKVYQAFVANDINIATRKLRVEKVQ